jgi:hypothetical protein
MADADGELPPCGRRGSPGLDQIFQFESMMIFLNPFIDIDTRPARCAKLAAHLAVAAAAFSAAPATGSGGN